jgi:hypothetical protein
MGKRVKRPKWAEYSVSMYWHLVLNRWNFFTKPKLKAKWGPK